MFWTPTLYTAGPLPAPLSWSFTRLKVCMPTWCVITPSALRSGTMDLHKPMQEPLHRWRHRTLPVTAGDVTRSLRLLGQAVRLDDVHVSTEQDDDAGRGLSKRQKKEGRTGR